MTDEEIKRLRELEAKATKGPWEAKEPAFMPGVKARVFGPTYKDKFDGFETMAVPDAAFIAAARSAVPELLDEVERLKQDNAAQECLLAEAVTGAQETEAELSVLRARCERLRRIETAARSLAEFGWYNGDRDDQKEFQRLIADLKAALEGK